MRICKGCGESKQLEDYHRHPLIDTGYTKYCESCTDFRTRTGRLKGNFSEFINLFSTLIGKLTNTKHCGKCQDFLDLTQFCKYKRSKDGLQYWCKNCSKKRCVEWNNSESGKTYYKKYKEKNGTWLKAKRNENRNRRRNLDPLYKVRCNLGSRLASIKDLKQSKKTEQLLGCSLSEFKLYFEKLFQPGMTWENYGHSTWHIDHIIPLASARTVEECEKLCHYTNLQPLWVIDHIEKSRQDRKFINQIKKEV